MRSSDVCQVTGCQPEDSLGPKCDGPRDEKRYEFTVWKYGSKPVRQHCKMHDQNVVCGSNPGNTPRGLCIGVCRGRTRSVRGRSHDPRPRGAGGRLSKGEGCSTIAPRSTRTCCLCAAVPRAATPRQQAREVDASAQSPKTARHRLGFPGIKDRGRG